MCVLPIPPVRSIISLLKMQRSDIMDGSVLWLKTIKRDRGGESVDRTPGVYERGGLASSKKRTMDGPVPVAGGKLTGPPGVYETSGWARHHIIYRSDNHGRARPIATNDQASGP